MKPWTVDRLRMRRAAERVLRDPQRSIGAKLEAGLALGRRSGSRNRSITAFKRSFSRVSAILGIAVRLRWWNAILGKGK